MKALPLAEHDLVDITWSDSNYSPGWNNKNRVTASIPSVVTVGYVTFSNRRILEVSNSIGDEGARLNPLSIPWSSITRCNIINVKG